MLYHFHFPVKVVTSMGHCPSETSTDHCSTAEPSSSSSSPEPFQNSKVIFLIDGLTVRNTFNMNEPLEVKERIDHGLLLQLAHLCLLELGGSPILPLSTLTFALRVIGKHPTLIISLYVIQET